MTKQASDRIAHGPQRPKLQQSGCGDDPVLELGREFGRLERRYEELDRAHYQATQVRKDEEGANEIDRRQRHVWDRMRQVQEAIQMVGARSLPGAVVVAVQANSLNDELANHFGIIAFDKNRTDRCDEYAAELFERLRTALCSILDVLRASAPGVYEECGGDYCASDRLNPFRAFDESTGVLRTGP